MSSIFKLTFLTLLFTLVTGCSITQKVNPVPEKTQIDKIWIEDNPKAHNENFDTEMSYSIKKLGFKSDVFPKGASTEGKTFVMKYTANWAWDLAMYLSYFQAELYENDKVIGSMTYDARSGGGSFDKFGKTMEKVDPLIKQLLKDAVPVTKVSNSSPVDSLK